MIKRRMPRKFSIDLCIIPCLFYIAIKCRHPKIRRRAVDLLRKAPRREALWDAEAAALSAEVAISFEECDMYQTENKRQIILPPEERRLHDVDIQESDSAHNGSLRVVLKSRPFAGCRTFQETVVHINAS